MQEWAAYVQYGFAGFAFVLVGVIVWLIQKLLEVHAETQGIVKENTAAITKLHEQMDKVYTTSEKSLEVLAAHHAFFVERLSHAKDRVD